MRYLFVIFCFPSCFALITAQEKYAKADSLLSDFRMIKTTLAENHPILFDHTSEPVFYRLCDSLENSIKQGQTLSQFQRSVNVLLSAVGCGHTYSYPTELSKNRLKQMNDLPFEVLIVDTAIFISKVYEKNRGLLPGEKILSINNIQVKYLIENSYREISSDGSNITHKSFLLQRNFNHYINTVLNYPASLQITTTNNTFTINYPTRFTKPLLADEEASFTDITGSKNTVLLRLPNFDEGKRIIKKCFAHIDKQHTTDLIIDLRGNGGGNGNIASYVLSHLLDTTATYYLDKKLNPLMYREQFSNRQGVLLSNQFMYKDSITKSYYFKIRPKAKHHFKGKVYVLANGGTFSSAAFAASLLKHKVKAVFIGQETGGSEYAIGGGVIGKLVLPYSGLVIKFPFYKWRFNATPVDKGKGVVPDFPVQYTTDLISSATDAELVQVMELINKK